MISQSIVRARIDKELKAKASNILSMMGLSVSDAIRLMLTQVVTQNALPFEIKGPNQITIDTFNDTDNKREIVLCENADDMFAKLGI